MRSDEDPAPSGREQAESPDGIPESEAMSGHGHEDPEDVDSAE